MAGGDIWTSTAVALQRLIDWMTHRKIISRYFYNRLIIEVIWAGGPTKQDIWRGRLGLWKMIIDVFSLFSDIFLIKLGVTN